MSPTISSSQRLPSTAPFSCCECPLEWTRRRQDRSRRGAAGVHKSSSDLSKRMLHAAIAFASAVAEAVSTLDHANAPLASGPPLVAIAENQRLLYSRLPVPLLVSD